MRQLTSVVIGCGAISRQHLAALAELKTVTVAAVCDISAARAEATAERFSIPKWYSSTAELFTVVRPDIVHITTPPSAHFSIAKECLEAGLNVLCEKPITVQYSELLELKALAIARGCFLMENQTYRFHSSIVRLLELIAMGDLGDILHVDVCIALKIASPGSPYTDPNAEHFSIALRGGVIGDFLPHIACLAHILVGRVGELRTIWLKRNPTSDLRADEFYGILKGERATATVSFSGNAQPNSFWVRVIGTQMHFEADLFEPPRMIIRRLRRVEPAMASFLNGLAESGRTRRGAVAGLFRKFAGTSSYDGLPELIARTYQALQTDGPQPISLTEIDEVSRLVDRFTSQEYMI
jgi:predicted dehydrogenase